MGITGSTGSVCTVPGAQNANIGSCALRWSGEQAQGKALRAWTVPISISPFACVANKPCGERRGNHLGGPPGGLD